MTARAAETPGLINRGPTPANVNTLDHDERVARGLVSGQISVVMNPRSPGLVAAPGWTDVTDHPMTFGAADTYQVGSSEISDGPGGTGARTVFVWGLSDTGSQVTSVYKPPWQSELVTMNGLAYVNTANQYLDVIGASIVNIGDSGTNDGDIDIRRATGAVNTTRIELGRGVSRDSVVSVPSGWHALVKKVQVFWTGEQPAEWELRKRLSGGVESTVIDGEVVASNSGQDVELAGGKCIEEEATLWFRARRSSGPVSESIRIVARVDLFVFDDDVIPPSLPAL